MSLESLPVEVLLECLYRLPDEDLFRLRRVNQYFRDLLCDEYFWKSRCYFRFSLLPVIPSDERLDWRKVHRDAFTLWGFGDFGLCDYIYRLIPCPYPGMNKIRFRQVANGHNFTVAIDFDHRVWVIGNNTWGQLGTASSNNLQQAVVLKHLRAIEVAAGNRHTVIRDLDNNVWVAGCTYYDQDQPRQLHRFRMIEGFQAKAIEAGGHHTLLIDLNDEVYSYGSNVHGQLGLGDTESRNSPTPLGMKAKRVVAGEEFSAIIDLENRLWVCGWNKFGQLGLSFSRYPPFITPNNRIETIPVALDIEVKAVACGIDHMVLMDFEGKVWSCGNNNMGQLCLGHSQNTDRPTKVDLQFEVKQISTGALFTVLIDEDYRVWTAGTNYFGTLGQGDSHHRAKLQMIKGMRALSVSTGHTHSSLIVLQTDY